MDRHEFIKGLEQGGRVCVELSSISDIPGWGELLEQITAKDEPTLDELVDLLTNYRIELQSGVTVEQLSLDDAFDIIALLLQRERSKLWQEWCDSVLIFFQNEFSQSDEKDFAEKEPSSLVKSLLGLPEVVDVCYTDISVYKSFRRRFIHLDPPWEALDIPCGSVGWRMGGGEDYMRDWFEFQEGLNSWEKELYFAHHIPPDDWKEWLRELMIYQ